MKKNILINIFLTLLLLQINSLDYNDFYDDFSSFLESMISPNEGRTSFRSLNIPSGGRSEAMGGAFTGLANDISYLEHNPAGAAILENTEFAAFHNSWIADSALDSIAFSQRFGNFGYGVGLRVFYVPFTEYNIVGWRNASGYYTESVVTLNAAYNFLAGYDFKGISVGSSLKFAYRGMPDYADKETDIVDVGSGLTQSGLAFLLDIGIQTRFSFGKFFLSRDPNLSIGFSILNIGAGITGFGRSIILDDPVPTKIAFGVSYQPWRPFVIAMEFQQPINLLSFSEYEYPYVSLGFSVMFAEFISMQAGFGLKGANPRVSLGLETSFLKIKVNACYTLDLSSSLNPFNRFSLSAKVNLGDMNRKNNQIRVDNLYNAGLYHYSQGNLENSIKLWEQALEIDKSFDPAKKGLVAARRAFDLQERIQSIDQDEEELLKRMFGHLESDIDFDALGDYEYDFYKDIP
ncbi:MAG: UPF0164 family protein [Treponemataceae bacterium]